MIKIKKNNYKQEKILLTYFSIQTAKKKLRRFKNWKDECEIMCSKPDDK